jgi:hypothetical protein
VNQPPPGGDEPALFVPDGDRYLPCTSARGPWRPDALHGAAVAALLANAIDVPGATPTRLTFDLLAPVPCAPLTLRRDAPVGGSRVVRQTVALCHDDAVVAQVSCVAVARRELVLPEAATQRVDDALAGVEIPDLSRPRRHVVDVLGWPSFDTEAVGLRRLRLPDAPQRGTAIAVRLLLPVVAGRPTSPVAQAAAAADYASNATDSMLPFTEWSFMNAELTVHLARIPDPAWTALLSTGQVEPNGCGLSAATLYDAYGRLGQASQTLVVEQRRHPAAVAAGAEPGSAASPP